jgi:lipid-binding SYLF domain-containing protein
MVTRFASVAVVLGLCGCLISCSTAPPTQAKLDRLDRMSADTLTRFQQVDPSLTPVLDKAAGWAVFPTVGEGAVGLGGVYGRGEVWVHNKLVGYCDVSAGTIGVQLGGDQYMELIVFQNDLALKRFQTNQWALAANASAIAAKDGAAAQASYADGTIVFTRPISGLIAAAAIGGQKFTYETQAAALESARAEEMR